MQDPRLAAALNALNASIRDLKKSVDDMAEEQSPAARAEQDKTSARQSSRDNINAIKEEMKLETDMDKLAKLRIDRIQAEIEATKLNGKSKEAQAKKIKRLRDQLELLTDAHDANTEAQKSAEGAGEALADTLGNMLGVSGKLNNSLMSQAKTVLTTEQGFKSFTNQLQETFTVGNVLSGALSKAFETTVFYVGRLFTEVDEGITSFNAATGAAGRFDSQLVSATQGLTQYGVAVKDVGNSMVTLMSSFPERELDVNAAQLASTFALWEKSGVSVDVATKSYTTLRRSLNMSNDDALELQNTIMALGDRIGVGGPKMIEDFASAAPRLAIHGANMEKVFRKVASASAQLGLEVDDVLSLAEGFQTFEGSAQAAGQLNAILGGGFINNIELMNAAFDDPAQAAMMIKNAFDDAGQSMETLGPAGIKAAAQAAGFSDVGKFTSFLNGEIDAAELAADESLELQKSMEAAAKNSLTALQSIDTAIKSLFEPLMPVLQEIATFIKEAPAKTKAMLILGAPVIGGLMLAGLAKWLGTAHATIVGRTIAMHMRGTEMLSNTTGMMGRFNASRAGKFLGRAGMVGAGAMLVKDIADVARGESNAENWGAIAGSVVGGTIGILGGPAGIALGATLGNMAGESLGKAFDAEQKKADAKMPEKKTAEQARHEEMMTRLDRLQKSQSEVKVRLDVDEFAYKRGLKLTTAEIMSGN